MASAEDVMDLSVIVLSLGIVVLLCGSVALLIVRWSHPMLRGTGWLSAAFATGALGAALILLPGPSSFQIFGADLGILSSFALVHVAVRRLLCRATGDASEEWRLPSILMCLQTVVDLLCTSCVAVPKLHVISLGFFVSLQTGLTAIVLWRYARGAVRAPALYSAAILVLFTIFNLSRSVVEASTYHQNLHLHLKIVTFVLYLGYALGLAFGFLWMTTATLAGELEHMASTDPLTRLFNRRMFLKWCERELLRSCRSDMPFSLLLIDLDYFKRINDEFGHGTGDQVLCAAVEQMQDSVRGIDVLCRWGGEEFAVLLPNATMEATRVVAERIRENVQRVTLPLSSTDPDDIARFCLTASIGTATFRDAGDRIASMLERADQALFEAKRAGRNRVLEAA